MPMPASVNTVSKAAVNWPARSRIRQCELVGAVTEIHKQIPGLLGGPRPVRMCGDAEDVHVPGADLEDEEHVQALRVSAQSTWKESQASIVAACVRTNRRHVVWSRRSGAGRYPQPFEDPADGGGADAVSEAVQFALDSQVAPAGIVPGHPLDQTGDGWVGWRTAGPVRVGPVAGHQSPMPGKNGGRADEPMALQRPGQESDQCRERCAGQPSPDVVWDAAGAGPPSRDAGPRSRGLWRRWCGR